MQKTVCALLFVGLLLLPAAAAEAAPISISSSTFASSTVSSTISKVNDWIEGKWGIDLYEIITRIINFVILIVKLSINVLLEILPKIRDFLSSY